MVDRAIPPEVNAALKALEQRIVKPFAVVGEPLEVFFPAANAPRDIQHGLGVKPTGVLVVLQVGGTVRASTPSSWTPELAFLEADAANVRGIVLFVVTREVRNALSS